MRLFNFGDVLDSNITLVKGTLIIKQPFVVGSLVSLQPIK